MDEISLNYIRNFLGYGNPNNRFWFIGMEEGGEYNVNRFNLWNQRGRQQSEDLVDFATALGLGGWFVEPYPLQSTWRQLIRIFLNAYGQEVTEMAIRLFQANCLGRTVAPLPRCHLQSPCLFELMPLPAPDVEAWPYTALYEQRETYEAEVMPERTTLLAQQINEFGPQIVCFYGTDYLATWGNIAGVEFEARQLFAGHGQAARNYWYGVRDATKFFVPLHPTAVGVPNVYFDALGQAIRDGGGPNAR